MPAARPLPSEGSVFLDCAGSFRLAVDDVPDLIALLRGGLDRAYEEILSRRADSA